MAQMPTFDEHDTRRFIPVKPLLMDADFVADVDCIGRFAFTRIQRACVDLLCRYTGHLLWRTGAVRVGVDSLPLNATYCRRCFKGGYVRGDYALPKLEPFHFESS